MKKTSLLYIILLMVSICKANILIPDGAKINELLWDENGNWQIELSYFAMDNEFAIDSLVLSTKDYSYTIDSTQLNHDNNYNYNYLVLNSEITGDLFHIDPLGDSIHIETFTSEALVFQFTEQFLIFGSYNNSMIQLPETSQSIACVSLYLGWVFAIDNSPTLGLINDLEGIGATISGRVFNRNNNPISIQQYQKLALDFRFQVAEDGTYSTHLVAGERRFSAIGFDQSGENYCVYYTIDPLQLALSADESYVDVDIKITDPDFVHIADDKSSEFDLFPNPMIDRLSIRVGQSFVNKEVSIVLVDVSGRQVYSKQIRLSTQNNLRMDSQILPGIYKLNVLYLDKNIYSENIIVHSF